MTSDNPCFADGVDFHPAPATGQTTGFGALSAAGANTPSPGQPSPAADQPPAPAPSATVSGFGQPSPAAGQPPAVTGMGRPGQTGASTPAPAVSGFGQPDQSPAASTPPQASTVPGFGMPSAPDLGQPPTTTTTTGFGTPLASGAVPGIDQAAVAAAAGPQTDQDGQDAQADLDTYSIGKKIAPRADLDPAYWVAVPEREPVTLPSGKISTKTPGKPKYPLPGPIRDFEPERDHFGRYKMPNPNTGEISGHTRATTIAKALTDNTGGKRALENYRDRMLIKGLIKAPELLEGFDTSLLDTVRERDLHSAFEAVAANASNAGGSSDKSEFGTAVHAWTEALDIGKISFNEVPDLFAPYVAAYSVSLSDAGVEVVPQYVERIVYCPATGSIGTADRLFLVNGELMIGDIKTSSNIAYSWPSISAQLAQYADASHIWSEDGTHWEPMPAVNPHFGVIAHVPALPEDRDRYCDLHIVNLDVGRRANELAMAVRDVNRRAKQTIPVQCQPFNRTSEQAIQIMRSGQVSVTSAAVSPNAPQQAPASGAAPSAAGLPAGGQQPAASEQPPAPAPAPAAEADTLTQEEVAAALASISQSTTVDELNALYRPVWESSPAGGQLMAAAQTRAQAIMNNASLRSA